MNAFVYCDTSLCIGCGMCERRCIMSHEQLSVKEVTLDEPTQRQRCKSFRQENVKGVLHCRHCENAPCMAACPVGAIERRTWNEDEKGHGQSGIIVNEDTCIGCKECVLACPFGAVWMAPTKAQRMVATKCDLCVTTEEGTPACVSGCPKKALRVVRLR